MKRKRQKNGTIDWNDVALRAAEAPSQSYEVVVVDESQDLSANQLRAVLAHLNVEHVTTFIIDAMQRIYPQGFRWQEIGIDMRPQMVFTLKRNHRNTREIALFASSLVRGLPPEEDGVLPNAEECQESGPLPKVIEGKYSEQIEYMLDQMQSRLDAGEDCCYPPPQRRGLV